MKLNISADWLSNMSNKYSEQSINHKHNCSCSLVLHRARPASSPAPAVTQLGTHLEVGSTVADSCCGMLLWHSPIKTVETLLKQTSCKVWLSDRRKKCIESGFSCETRRANCCQRRRSNCAQRRIPPTHLLVQRDPYSCVF